MTIFRGVLYMLTWVTIIQVACQRREIQSGFTPPKFSYLDTAFPPANPRQDGPIGVGLGGIPEIPPQNNPVSPIGPIGGPLGGPPNGGIVPFGLNHVILIVVPMFKTKLRKLPDWLTSTVKISMPITVFFDQMNVPPGMFLPALGGLPLPFPPPVGLTPPGGLGALPFPPTSIASSTTPTGAPSLGAELPSPPSYPQTVYQQQYDNDQSFGVDDAEQSDLEVSYDDSYYPEEDIKRRWKRSTWFKDVPSTKKWSKKAFKFNETIHAAERAALIPRMEALLENAGFGGKSCLLRAICEIHESSLHHYGLIGELFTMIFSVSKSAFAESHLPEYLLAEAFGKTGDCSEYHRHCQNSIFVADGKSKLRTQTKDRKAFIINEIDEVL